MADGAQRLLDVIDDPNALESFLGGLTADSELLPSESVDNVVASLARSLEGDYEVDSPNETLFDTLEEASSNNLTDISQSYVTSDFDNVNMSNVGGQGTYNSGMGSLPNGEITHQVHHQQQQQDLQNSLSSVVSAGTEQYLISTNQSSSNNSISNNVATSLQQFTSNNSNCDSSSIVSTTSAVASSSSQFVQQQHQQIQISQNQILLQNSGNNSTYVLNQDLLQKQNMVNQTQQMTSLSHSNVDSQNSNPSMNNMISVSISNNNDGRQVIGNAFQQQQEMTQQSQMQVITQGQLTSNSNVSIVNVNNSSNNSSVSSTTTASNEMSCNVTGNSNSMTSSTSNAMQQQYVANTAPQTQQTTINQLLSGQTVSLANLNMGGAQIIATSSGNIVTTGQGQANILQQIQSANGGQYITVDQPTALIAAGPSAFGSANLALMTTGGTPTYAVVPTGTQFLSNAIMTQPQAIQTLTKGPNGTYYQTGGTQIVATSNVNAIQNVSVTVSNANTNKPKQPPQLLPKPHANGVASNNQGNGNGSAGISSGNCTPAETVSSSSVTSTNTTHASGTITTPTEGVMAQIFQQQQTAQIQGIQNQVVVTSVGNNTGTVTIPQQPSFTIGNAAGIGQVVVSQNPNQQTQLTGTIVVNQYGQPMLLPSASASQSGGLQFIVRQQPAQPQVLTFQTPGTTTIGTAAGTAQSVPGKPIIRYVSQMPQVAQSGGIGLQQIQTPNGPQWFAVRYPQPATSIATSGGQISQIQTETLLPSSSAVQAHITSQQQQQIQVQVQAQQLVTPSAQPQAPQHQTQVHVPQHQAQMVQQQPQVVEAQKHQPQISQPKTPQPQAPHSQPPTPPVQHQPAQVATPDSSSSEPPPAKKAKSRAKSSKKKVCLDLEQLLKQSGIMDEDLQDDNSFDFSFSSQDVPQNGFSSPTVQPAQPVQNQSPMPVSPMQTNPSPVQHPAVNTSGKGKHKSKNEVVATPKKPPAKSRRKRKKSPSPPPPPPPPPTKGKGSRKRGGNQKADSKTENSKNKPPLKLSSIDSVTATIMAVAAGSPSPPPSPAPPPTPAPSSPAVAPAPSIRPVTPNPNPSPLQSAPINNGNLTANGLSSILSQTGSGTTRIVHTIQLTPQNQQLLRNIQTQIQRLLQFTKRNETEQTALQKLIHLQQQVIATGIPVPNPTHLSSNLSPNATATVLPASAFASCVLPTTSGSTTTAAGESLIATSSSSTSMASNSTNLTSIPQNINNPVSLPTNQSSSVSAVKLQGSKVTATSNPVSTAKSVTTGSVIPSDSSSNDNTNKSTGTVGNVVQAQASSGGVKVVISNANSESSIGPQTPEENKENNTGSPGMVVAASNFATATNTTNSLGQKHFQTYTSSFRNTLDDKKAEEQRLANQKAEAEAEEKRARWKKEEFEMLLKRDQQCVVRPDYEIPFSSKRDAMERLMKYHILRDRNDMSFGEFDSDFGEKASVLLDKFHGMIAKHRSLLLKESMKEVGCAERVMLERMFVAEEKLKLEQDRQFVSQGEILELPPPPASWIPKIKEMVDKEVKELERDSFVNQHLQSAIDSIICFGNNDPANVLPDEGDKVEYDAFGVPINNGAYAGINSSSSADIDEAVRSILA